MAETAVSGTLFHQIQAQLERQLVESTIRRRELQRQQLIPDVDLPLFEFEVARAGERREQRRRDEQTLLEAASGHGQVHMTIASSKPDRRFSVRSWKALTTDSSNVISKAVYGNDDPRENALVRRWVDLFWLTCNRDQHHGVLQRAYCDMYLNVLKTLYESFDTDKAGQIARRHFAQIVGAGGRGLSRDAMRRAMFDTAAAWVTTPISESYIDFFKKLFYRISTPRNGKNVGEYKWRDLESVPSSMDETRRPFNLDSIPDYVKLVGTSGAARRLPVVQSVSRKPDSLPETTELVQTPDESPSEDDSSRTLPPIKGSERSTPPPNQADFQLKSSTMARNRRQPERIPNTKPKKRSVDDINLEKLRRKLKESPNVLLADSGQIPIRDLILDPLFEAKPIKTNGRRVSRDTNWLEVRSTPLKNGKLPALAGL